MTTSALRTGLTGLLCIDGQWLYIDGQWADGTAGWPPAMGRVTPRPPPGSRAVRC